jgi:hypothetical protein
MARAPRHDDWPYTARDCSGMLTEVVAQEVSRRVLKVVAASSPKAGAGVITRIEISSEPGDSVRVEIIRSPQRRCGSTFRQRELHSSRVAVSEALTP